MAQMRGRAALLLLVVLLTVAGVWIADRALDDGEVYRRVFHPALADKNSGPEWQHLVQALVLMLGVPVAYLIWHWRDENSRAQIENARKDTNLREFQELQLRAAGGVGADDDRAVAQTLQIAALHQMRAFLRGDYGDGFRRPAFELYCALLARPKEVIVRSGRDEDEGQDDAADQQEELPLPLAPAVYRAIRDIIEEEWDPFFNSGFSLSNRSFREIRISQANISGLDFTGSDFSGSRWYYVAARSSFANCRFDGFDGEQVWFDDANLTSIRLSGARFVRCDFPHVQAVEATGTRVDFRSCFLAGAVLRGSRFSDLTLSGCQLEGADLSEVSAHRVHVSGSSFDDRTKLFDFEILLTHRGPTLTDISVERVTATPKEKWLFSGARYVSEGSTEDRQIDADQ